MAGGSVTLSDLARMAGVSIATVSRALNDHTSVRWDTKEQIWALAKKHRYPLEKRRSANSLGAIGCITLVLPIPQGRDTMLDDPFLLELVAGIGDAARERHCDLHLSHVLARSDTDIFRMMASDRSDGVIFLGQSSLHDAFNELANKESRFAVWGAQMPNQKYCSVGSSNEAGGRRATSHLLRIGRNRIIFLGDSEAPEVVQRLQGYREAMVKFALDLDPCLQVPAHFTVESGEAAIDALISRNIHFDGVVAASDLIAIGAIRSLENHGISVPDDVSVIGYDDIPIARYNRPALSTITQDTRRAGRALISKILDRGEGRMRAERLPTDLMVRQSCGG